MPETVARILEIRSLKELKAEALKKFSIDPNDPGVETGERRILKQLTKQYTNIWDENNIKFKSALETIEDHLQEFILSAGEQELEDFIANRSYRQTIYRNKLIDLYRLNKTQHQGVTVLAQAEQNREALDRETKMSYPALNILYSRDFFKWINSLTDNNPDKYKILILLRGIAEGESNEEIAAKLELKSQGNITTLYASLIRKYEFLSRLPPTLKELRQLIHGESRRTQFRRKQQKKALAA